MTTPSAISISHRPNSFFVSTGAFESRRKISLRRPHPLSLTPTTQAGETTCFAAHIHPPFLPTAAPLYAVSSKLRLSDRSNTSPPTSLAFVEFAGVGGVFNASDGHVGTIEATGPCPPTTKKYDIQCLVDT